MRSVKVSSTCGPSETIEGGIELLTGVDAGEWSDDGGWSEGSVFGRCQERLNEMVRLMRRSGKGQAGVG